jgi:Ca2+-binding EF-hand superfamily protein
MKMELTTAIALALAWSAGAQQAPAPAPAPAAHAKLMAADTNKDGKITFDELKAVRPGITQERFNKMDRNGDGALSPEDRGAKGKPKAEAKPEPKPAAGQAREKAGERLKAADTNGDGQISAEEFKTAFPKAPQDRFAKLDRNKDGFLSKADRPEGQAGGDAGPARHDMAAKLQKADANGDGKVTYEEAVAAKPGLPRADFDRFDSNKDGVLDASDVHEAPAAQEGQHGGQRLKAADTNNDGRVSWEEAQAAMPKLTRERFNKLDRNGDGFISKDDRAQQQ